MADFSSGAPLQLTSPVATELVAGSQIGEYQIIQRIGAGGMGVVYAGEQPVIGKKVAIKVLLPEIAHDEDAARRFLLEARSANQIGHRNIIDIFSFGKLPDGRQYLVMEFLNGQPLDEVIRERAPLPAAEALQLLDDVASGLAAAHAAGILHRDLKPSNLFVVEQADGSSFVKILDFGLAKTTRRREESSPTTHFGTVLGTPEYMAPEQARGEDLDHRVDLYAFGVISYELLTGRIPLQGKSELETISKHLTEAPKPLSEVHSVNPELAALVMGLLEKDREKRPASFGVVRAEFKRIRRILQAEATQIVGQTPVAVPPPVADRTPETRPEGVAPRTDSLRVERFPREWIIAFVAATLGIAMAIVALVALNGREEKTPPVPVPASAAVSPEPSKAAPPPAPPTPVAPADPVTPATTTEQPKPAMVEAPPSAPAHSNAAAVTKKAKARARPKKSNEPSDADGELAKPDWNN